MSSMNKNTRSIVTDGQWDNAADLYELGMKTAKDIAFDFGVHPTTVSRRLKAMGCVKGSRASETVVDLEAFLKRKAQRRDRMRQAQQRSHAARQKETEKAIGRLVGVLIAADKAGRLAELGPAMERMRRSVGAKRLR